MDTHQLSNYQNALFLVMVFSSLSTSVLAEHKKIHPEIESTLPDMVRVPAGNFLWHRGDSELDKIFKHKVTIKEFELSIHEVTFDSYDSFAKATDRELPDDFGWGRESRPVINVSWEDAKDYVAWLSEQTGHQYRLPSGSEWEYAARAGTTTKYSWGDELGKNNANCWDCWSQWDDQMTAPVGSFSSNAFGLYDMHGNVWEWVEDCYQWKGRNAPTDGSAWTENGRCDQRMVHGGSFAQSGEEITSDWAFDFLISERTDVGGFRIARTVGD